MFSLEELRSEPDPRYLSPVIKPYTIKLSRSQQAEIEAVKIIVCIINPIIQFLSPQVPESKEIKLHMRLIQNAQLEFLCPSLPGFSCIFPPIKELNFFSFTLEKISKIAPVYHNIQVEKQKDFYWVFTKNLAESKTVAEKKLFEQQTNPNNVMQQARKEKGIPEDEADKKISEILDFNRRQLEQLISDNTI